MSRVIAKALDAGIAPSFFASLIAHIGLLALGLAAWNVAGQFPTEAFEVSLDQFSTQAGVARRKIEKKAVIEPAKSSQVDMALEKKAKPEPVKPQVAQEGANLKEGKGGDSATSRSRALSEWEMYQASVHDRVHDALLYPSVSKNLGETGRVKVKFTILKDGTIADVGVFGPSAFERLNRAAVETVRRIAKLDPLPASYSGNDFQAIIPIDYVLR